MADDRRPNRDNKPSIQIPKNTTVSVEENQDGGQTPKTPADEGIDFFQAGVSPGEAPIRVYDLGLDPDGGPSKDLSVRSRLHLWLQPSVELIDSTFAFHPHTRPTYFVSQFKQERLPRRMAYSRRISPWMAACSGGITLRRGREYI